MQGGCAVQPASLSIPFPFNYPVLFFAPAPVCVCFQATYLVDCITDKAKSNKILNIGGPDDGLTMTAQGKLVSERDGPP